MTDTNELVDNLRKPWTNAEHWQHLGQQAADEITRLQAELDAANEKLAWQPIETAPKDGTKILLWGSGTGSWPCKGQFAEGDYWAFTEPCVGWPELWMPLPEPPKETDQ